MKFLFTSLLLLGFYNSFAQTTGNIDGKVSLVDGQPAGSVSVSLIELHKNTLTDDHGNYTFKKIIPGKYTIRIQMLGAAQKDLPVTVIAGQTTNTNYQLAQENVQALQEVTIGGTANRFSKKKRVYILRVFL
ncbi:carboxypeptidase-like regulatory domain-containing protein [Pedobacter sp. NJ-S-72]